MKIKLNHVSAELHWQLPTETIEIDVQIPAEGIRSYYEDGSFREEDLRAIDEVLAERIIQLIRKSPSGSLFVNEIDWWGADIS